MPTLQETLEALRMQVELNPYTPSQNLPAESRIAPLLPQVLSSPQCTPPKAAKNELKQQLSILLSQCISAMKQYGKTLHDLPAMVECFYLALKDESLDNINNAFGEYLKRGRGIPEPSDIYNIINPPPAELSAAVYVALKKRSVDGEYLYGSDKAYVQAFEAQEMAKMRGGTPELKAAQIEVENYTALTYQEYNHEA